MYKLKKCLLPFVVLSMLAINNGDALECYVCDSTSNNECLVPTKSSSLKTETCTADMITKPKTTINWIAELVQIDYLGGHESSVAPRMICESFKAKNEAGDEVVYRGCQLHGAKTDTCQRLIKKGLTPKHNVVVTECSVCEEDACNNSTQFKISSICVLITAFVFKTFY